MQLQAEAEGAAGTVPSQAAGSGDTRTAGAGDGTYPSYFVDDGLGRRMDTSNTRQRSATQIFIEGSSRGGPAAVEPPSPASHAFIVGDAASIPEMEPLEPLALPAADTRQQPRDRAASEQPGNYRAREAASASALRKVSNPLDHGGRSAVAAHELHRRSGRAAAALTRGRAPGWPCRWRSQTMQEHLQRSAAELQFAECRAGPTKPNQTSTTKSALRALVSRARAPCPSAGISWPRARCG